MQNNLGAVQIFENLRHMKGKSTVLSDIGMIYYARENYPEALDIIEEALGIINRLGLGNSPNAQIFKESTKKIVRYIIVKNEKIGFPFKIKF